MAGRKDKNTVDYFPHYCKSGKTLFIIENKFGNDGYAVWFKILELLGSNDNHYINCNDLSNWEFLQAQMRVSESKLIDILNCLSNLDAIHKELWENKIIWSSNFIKNINDAYLRRKTQCMNFYDLCTHLTIKCKHKYNKIGIIEHINTQSKVKESKVKEIKENKIPTLKEFGEYAIEHKPNADKLDIKLKYEAWVANEWKDGNNKKIVNWKSKLLQTLPHIKESKETIIQLNRKAL